MKDKLEILLDEEQTHITGIIAAGGHQNSNPLKF